MALSWQRIAGAGLAGKGRLDCFADGQSGRWVIKQAGGRSPHYVLRLDNKIMGRFGRMVEAQAEAAKLDQAIRDQKAAKGVQE